MLKDTNKLTLINLPEIILLLDPLLLLNFQIYFLVTYFFLIKIYLDNAELKGFGCSRTAIANRLSASQIAWRRSAPSDLLFFLLLW